MNAIKKFLAILLTATIITTTVLNIVPLMTMNVSAEDWNNYNWDNAAKQNDAWYRSNTHVLDAIIQYQKSDGGWTKPIIGPTSGTWSNSTIDNDMTTTQIIILARGFKATNTTKYRDACYRGIDLLINSQYPTGGWPQVFGLPSNYTDYHKHITYNDGAMIRVMRIIRDVSGRSGYFSFVDTARAGRAQTALNKGIECILNTQITINGVKTAWAQQHDAVTLNPAPGRAYEPAVNCTSESVGIVDFLKSHTPQTAAIANSINAAVTWFDQVKIMGIRVENITTNGSPDRRVVNDPSAGPLWARFYNNNNQPVFGDRDGKVYSQLSQISQERRAGYAWYGTWPRSLVQAGLVPVPGDGRAIVTFNANGGTVSPTNATVGENNRLSSLPTPTRTGFTFKGWFTAATGGTAVDLNRTYTSNTTIYAQWTLPNLNGTLIKDLVRLDQTNANNWSIQTNLKNGDVIYGDRTNTFTSIPSSLAGAEWIRLAADSKELQSNVAEFTAGADITAYIGLDNRVVPANLSWLSGWTKTNMTATASNNVTYDIYQRNFNNGAKVTLGTNGSPSGVIMYTVFVAERAIEPLNGVLIKNLQRFDKANAANWSIQYNPKVGDLIYGDRANAFATLPSDLSGTEWIRPAADSRNMTTNVAEFTAGANITAYIGLDIRVNPPPSWLNDWELINGMTFTATGGETYNVYQRDFNNGAKVTIGATGATSGVIMHTIFVKEREDIPVIIPPLNGTLIKDLKRFDKDNYEAWSIQNNLQIDNEIYGDRNFTFSTLPAELLGAEWIRTSTMSRTMTSEVAEFTAGEDISVYVAMESRLENEPRPAPEWLSGWTLTELTATVTEGANTRTYYIYRRDFDKDEKIILGANGLTSGINMYSVFVKSFGIPLLNGVLIKDLQCFDKNNYQNWSIESNLQNWDVIYGDRAFTFTDIPTVLEGAEWIKLAADSKFLTTNAAEFVAGDDIIAYIGLDRRVDLANTPWLSDWSKTDLTISPSNPEVTYDLYERNFAAGETVTLGTNGPTSYVIMYTVFVIPQSAVQTTTVPTETTEPDSTTAPDSATTPDSTTTPENSTTAPDYTSTPDSTATPHSTTVSSNDTTDNGTTSSDIITSSNGTTSGDIITSSNGTDSSDIITSSNGTTSSDIITSSDVTTSNNGTVSSGVINSSDGTSSEFSDVPDITTVSNTTPIVTTPTGPGPSSYLITFNQNYDGAPANMFLRAYPAVGGIILSDNFEPLESLPAPTRDGYVFNGWFTEKSGGAAITADRIFTADMTVYAQWISLQETITSETTTTACSVTTTDITTTANDATISDNTTTVDSTTAPEITTELTTTTEPLPDCGNCDRADCEVCSEGGKWYALGNVDGKDTVTIFDALEILKHLVGMSGAVDESEGAFRAALITEQSKENDVISIFDALEILKHLVGMASGIDGTHINGVIVIQLSIVHCQLSIVRHTALYNNLA